MFSLLSALVGLFLAFSRCFPLLFRIFCVMFEVRSQNLIQNPLFLGYSPGKAGFLYPFCGYEDSISPVLGDFNSFSLIMGDFVVLHKKEGDNVFKMDRLLDLMKKNGRSARYMSEQAGMSQGYIKDLKAHSSSPSAHAVEVWASILGTTPAYLMGETDDPAPLPSGAWEADMGNVAPLLGTVRAGLPMYAEENIEDYIPIRQADGAKYFWLRVRGDSMNAAGIFDGDEILVRQQPEVEDNQIAVVLVNGDEATVKRFHQQGDMVLLTPQSYNPEHQTQLYNIKQTTVRVVGLVVESRRKF